MDKVVFDKLSSFNLNHQQKRDLIDVIKYVSKDDNFEDVFILNIYEDDSNNLIVKKEDIPNLCKALLDKKQIVAIMHTDKITVNVIAISQTIVPFDSDYLFNVSFNIKIDNSPMQYISVFGYTNEEEVTVNVSVQDTLIPEDINFKFKQIENNINSLKKVATKETNGLMSKEDKTSLDTLASQGTLHDLFLSLGATYNQDTKMYQMNGLDLTFGEMLDCYKFTYPMLFISNWNYTAELSNIRTNIKPFGLMSWLTKSTNQAFRECSNLEIVDMRPYNFPNHFMRVSRLFSTFFNCNKLKAVYGFDLEMIKTIQDTQSAFNGCINLAHILFTNLSCDIHFKDSPLLTKDSILFLITKAKPEKAITVTLHPTAYAMATADAEIQAALQAQPLVSLAEGLPTV